MTTIKYDKRFEYREMVPMPKELLPDLHLFTFPGTLVRWILENKRSFPALDERLSKDDAMAVTQFVVRTGDDGKSHCYFCLKKLDGYADVERIFFVLPLPRGKEFNCSLFKLCAACCGENDANTVGERFREHHRDLEKQGKGTQIMETHLMLNWGIVH